MESLQEGWERFKELQRQCPHHAIPKWHLVQSFYQGCNRDNRTILDSAAKGRFMNQAVDAAYDLIEKIATHNAHYSTDRDPVNKEKMYNVDVKFENLSSEVHALHQKLDKLLVSLDHHQCHRVMFYNHHLQATMI